MTEYLLYLDMDLINRQSILSITAIFTEPLRREIPVKKYGLTRGAKNASSNARYQHIPDN